MHWLFLSIAIVVGSTALKSSNGFTRLWPSLLVLAGYAIAFFFLSLTLRTIPIGITYAIWSGAGTVLIAAVGYAVHGQTPDVAAVIGMMLIIGGVVVINVFSKSAVLP